MIFQFTTTKKELLNSLTVLDKVVEGKVIYNIESNVLLELNNDTLILRGTNGSLTVSDKIVVNNVSGEGSVCVYSKKLNSIIKEMPNDNIVITVEENEKINIKSENGKIKHLIIGMKANDFPEIEKEEYNYFDISKSILKTMFDKVINIVATEPFKPVLRGVYITKQGNEISMVGCDGRRLGIITRTLEIDGDFTALIDLSVVHNILTVLDDSVDNVRMGINEKSFYIAINNFEFTTSMIEGKYPNYKQIFHNEYDYNFKVVKSDIQQAVKRIIPMINDVRSKRIVFEINKDTMIIKGINEEIGESISEVDINYDGEAFSIAFNYVYILSAIDKIDSEVIEFCVNKGAKPTKVKEFERLDYFYVIMPMSIGED